MNAREMHENIFSSKTLSNLETFEITTKRMQRRLSNENIKAEKVFHQVWSTTKVGVILGKP